MTTTATPPPASAFLAKDLHDPIAGDRQLTNGELRPTFNPATGEALTSVRQCTVDEVGPVVETAHDAFRNSWGRLTPGQREELLVRFADVVRDHSEELAMIETLDNGMPLSGSRGSVARAVAHLRYNAGWATKVTGDSIEPSKPGREFFAYTVHQPVGVVAAIVPWNSPLISTVLKVSAALAAGCTVVIKPATETPLSALRLAELALEAGLPPGAVNVLPGPGHTVGQALIEHPLVRKVSFTGSTDVGQAIMRSGADRITRLTLELGGKSPDIVFSDVDLDRVVPATGWAVFRNSGQVCVAGSRLFVHKGVYDEFLERLIAFTETVTVGNGLVEGTQLGPLITNKQTDSVLDYVDSGVKDGARLLIGGDRICDAERPSGQFIAPAVFADVSADMRLSREEIFGPVAVVSQFETVEEAVELANDTHYGLAAGIWTDDLSIAHRVARDVQAGMVWVNCYSEYDPALPFGGHKLSGHGAKSGREAVLECTELKTVVMELDAGRS